MEKVKIYLQKKYFDILDFKYFTNKLFWINDYELFEKETKNGQYMKLEYNWRIVYVLLSRENAVESRNAYISQSLITSINYIEKSENKNYNNLEIYYYLIDISNKAKTDFNIFIYRWLETLWIKLLNSKEFLINILPFIDFKDMYNAKILMRKEQNNPSYFEELDDNVNYFIKTFWANGKEAPFNCLVISKLINKPIIIFQIEDNWSASIWKEDIVFLENNNIFVDKENIIKEYERKWLINTDNFKSYRKQWRFKANLLRKFWEKKCYLCWCDIDNVLIASHIHRVADISNDNLLSPDEKFLQSSDWDNWFWLCWTHDLLFENWIIYFDGKKLILNETLLEKLQINFIKNITINYQIHDIHFNDKISIYLEKHKNRVLR